MTSLTEFLQKVESTAVEPSRQTFLRDAASQIRQLIAESDGANLLFVCTHNSRRSQFSHLWADWFRQYYQITNLTCQSCGTEVTACHPNTLAALKRAGVEASEKAGSTDKNPHWHCTAPMTDWQQPSAAADTECETILFSKKFGDPVLPTQAIAAMMCCDDVDSKCPVVPGARVRIPLHYKDPKSSDGTNEEQATYDARNLEIASEMLFLIRALR